MTEPCSEIETIADIKATGNLNKWLLGGIFSVGLIGLIPSLSMSNKIGHYEEKMNQIIESNEKMSKDVESLKDMSGKILVITKTQAVLEEKVSFLEDVVINQNLLKEKTTWQK